MDTLHGFQLLDFSHYNKSISGGLGVIGDLGGGLRQPQDPLEGSHPHPQPSQQQQPHSAPQSTAVRQVTNGARKFECTVCHKPFKQLAHLNTHALLHEGKRPHKCSYCEQTFSQLTHLKRHLVTHRTSDEVRAATTYSCHMCPRKFAFPSDLNSHLNKHYNREQRKSGNQAAQNRNIAQQSNYKCGMCDKSFQYPSQLREHMFVHTHIRRFPCGECGRRFMKDHHLKIHQQSTHQCLRPHTCHICNKTFSIKANLERHLFVHNTKTFECTICSKRFAQPQTLKMHMVSHNDVKPFQCSICGKGLARAHNLRAHMAIHRQNKPYTCQQCNATFTLKGNLQRHMKEKHSFEAQISVDDGGSQSEPAFNDRSSPDTYQHQDDPHDGRQSEDSLESEIDPVDFDSTSLGGGTPSTSTLNLGNNSQQQQPGLFQPYANCTPAPPPPPPPTHTADLFHHPLPVFSHHQHVSAHLPVPHPHPFYAPPPSNSVGGPSDLPLSHTPLQLAIPHEPASVVVTQHNEVGARLQAIHAALDELASHSGVVVQDKISAIHMAVDDLIGTNQSQTQSSMLDLRSAASQLEHL